MIFLFHNNFIKESVAIVAKYNLYGPVYSLHLPVEAARDKSELQRDVLRRH